MKLLSVLTHPILVLALFCAVLVSGEHFGGFYLLYILMALPYGGIHALLGLIGTALLIFSYVKYKRQAKYFIDLLMNIFGVFALYFSLTVFFWNSWAYNDQTFQQGVPIASYILFGMVSLGFLIDSIVRFARSKPNHHRSLLT